MYLRFLHKFSDISNKEATLQFMQKMIKPFPAGKNDEINLKTVSKMVPL